MSVEDLLADRAKNIKTNEDAIRGIINCFKNGIAE